jgi:NADPH2:quinone reductase
MRAWRVQRLGAPQEVLEIADLPDPGLVPGHVLIRVSAAALNLPDVMMCHGTYQAFPPSPPFTPGLEVAGRVEAAAPGLEHWVGRRVVGIPIPPNGGLAEQALVSEDVLFEIPDTLEDQPAAAIVIAYVNSHVALHRRGKLQAEETLLVHGGAGGVGSAAIQLGVAAGARVLATAGGAEKTRFCEELGADLAIDYHSEDFVEAVREATGGRGADVIYDPVGGEVGERSRQCIAPEGRRLIIGFAGGERDIPPLAVVLGNFSVVGCYWSNYSYEQRHSIYQDVLKLINQGRVRPVVGRTIAFDKVPAALADLEARRVLGKVVVRL